MKDNAGRTGVLNKEVKNSKGDYLVLINGQGSGGYLRDLYIQDGRFTGSNYASNTYQYLGYWKFIGVSNVTTTPTKAPIQGSTKAIAETLVKDDRTVLDKLGIAGGVTFGTRERNIFVIALALIGGTIWVLTSKKRKKR